MLEMPEMPEMSQVSFDVPEADALAEVPEVPEMPEAEMLEMPEMPERPERPEVPEKPEMPFDVPEGEVPERLPSRSLFSSSALLLSPPRDGLVILERVDREGVCVNVVKKRPVFSHS